MGWVHSARGIEVRALAAGMEFEAALRTFSDGFCHRSQQSAALRATRNRVRARHLQGARAEGFFLDGPFSGLLLALFVSAAVLIAVLAILL